LFFWRTKDEPFYNHADEYGYDERHDDEHVPYVRMLKKIRITAWIVSERIVY